MPGQQFTTTLDAHPEVLAEIDLVLARDFAHRPLELPAAGFALAGAVADVHRSVVQALEVGGVASPRLVFASAGRLGAVVAATFGAVMEHRNAGTRPSLDARAVRTLLAAFDVEVEGALSWTDRPEPVATWAYTLDAHVAAVAHDLRYVLSGASLLDNGAGSVQRKLIDLLAHTTALMTWLATRTGSAVAA